MKKLALTVAGIALAGPLMAGSARGQTPPPGDSSFGQGHVLQTDFAFTSRAGPNGEDLVGTLTTSGFLNFTASLTCASSSGNAVVGGYRIETGEMAGRGFLSAAIDNGPARNGRPVDVAVYSGYLPRPPINCPPSPGEPPPPGFRSTGAGPFTSGDFTLVNATERLPAGAAATRIAAMHVTLRPRRIGVSTAVLSVRARVCGQPGVALFRLVERSSPTGRSRPVDLLVRRHDEQRHDGRCVTHRMERLLSGFPGGRRYTVSLRARTSGRKWSRPVVRYVDAR